MSSHHKNGKEVSKNWDDVFKALLAEPRRQLLISLADASPDQSVPLPEGAMMPNVPSDPETLRQELYHIHLPILEDREFIRWESEPLVASRGPQFEQVAVVVEAVLSDATNMPDSLVVGCQRLEAEQQADIDL